MQNTHLPRLVFVDAPGSFTSEAVRSLVRSYISPFIAGKPPLVDEIFRIQGGFTRPQLGSSDFWLPGPFLHRFTNRNRCFQGAKTQNFLAAGGGRKFCTFMTVFPLKIAVLRVQNPKFSGRRRRPKILASGADLGYLSSSNKGGFISKGGFTR